MAEPVHDFVITPHGEFEMERRGIGYDMLRHVLEAPEQRECVRPNRDVLQSRIYDEGREFLVRVFVDVDRVPPEVVTVYRTSKVDKYWRNEP